MDFDDASGLDSSSQDVLLGGLVLLGTQPVEVVQETKGLCVLCKTYYAPSSLSISLLLFGRIVELVFIGSGEAFLNAFVHP